MKIIITEDDYEWVLAENNVLVSYGDKLIDGNGDVIDAPPHLSGWSLSWKHGAMFIGQTTEEIARKAAAAFVSLWTHGMSASFADRLMLGYVLWLEMQES